MDAFDTGRCIREFAKVRATRCGTCQKESWPQALAALERVRKGLREDVPGARDAAKRLLYRRKVPEERFQPSPPAENSSPGGG